RWLSQRLSHRLGHGPGREDGVCAGVSFRSPASLVAEITGTADDDPWAPDALVWPLLGVVDAHAGEPWCHALSLHLGHGQEGEEGELRRGRRYAVARRLARLFASYATQRPALLAEWEAGRDTDGAGSPLAPDLTWQAELWRRLVAAVGVPSPGRRHDEVCARLESDPGSLDLPDRFSLFGHTRIPVTEVELLAALGQHREVHLWLPHPSPVQWRALAHLGGAVPRAEDTSQDLLSHPLLASLGRDVRELQRTLVGVGAGAGPDPASPSRPAGTLLGWLQDDLAADRSPDPGTTGESGGSGQPVRVLDPADRSVQVHACHGPARQVEVLREVLLGLLADDPTLEPRDILVMCPDIEAYAPLVAAAFGMGEIGGHPGHQLRVRLADRSLTQTNPLLAVVGQLLDLAGGRAEASRVLDLVATDAVRRRFRFTDNDLETITGWVEKAGVRWAFDEAHRAPYGLERYVQNTWRFGLDRVLAGVAVSDDADRFFGTTLPLDDVGSTTIDLAGRLAELLDRLRRVTDALTGNHPVAHWLEAIGDGVEQLTAVARDDEWQTAQVHRELAATLAATSGAELDLRLPDVRALMRERLAGRPTRANFRTGTLTVATLVPMRSVPHRVVCLLGLDDGVFPRAGAVDGDDVLARRPFTGERDARSEDRQLMLDALLSATDHLVVTFTGADETTGAPRPPAVPLGELLDALDVTAPGGRAHALRRHPLQAFDARNLDPGDPGDPAGAYRPFSFDAGALAGARASTRARVAPASLGELALPVRPDDVELASLVSFLKHPVREFLRRRLEVALVEEGDEVSDGLPVELDGLAQWGVGDRMLRDLLAGRGREEALGKEWRRGVLPPGQLGWRLAQKVVDEAVPVAEVVESITQGVPASAVDVDVDLGHDRRLRGTVTDLHRDRIVKVSFSRLGPKHLLDAWVPLLALCAARPGRPWSAGAVGRGRGRDDGPVARTAFASVESAGDLLRDLVALYDAGMSEPLPLPLKTGHAWALARRSPAQARYRADQEWSRGRFGNEDEDPAHVYVWGPGASLDTLLAARPRPGEELPDQPTRLGALACRLWVPLLERAR
ncbi:MAG: recC, partial [Marmoricola sp.]|nr:recC [Marmoricola sp.]